jgi:histidine ammonia-lyase
MKLMEVIKISGDELPVEDIIKVAGGGGTRIEHYARIELGDLTKVRESADLIARKVSKGVPIYGVTTGFGAFAHVFIDNEEDAKLLQKNLLISHATGVGDNFERHIVRAIMLIRLNTLMKGNSGIQVQTLERLVYFLNERVHPVIPNQGSLGASGDLCPLSHMALPLIGEGYVEYKDTIHKTADFYELEEIKAQGIGKLELSYKEGLALNNGTSVMAALGTFAIYNFERLLKLATLTSSLMLEAFCARKSAFDERIHKVRNHAGQIMVAAWIRKFTEGSSFVGISPSTLRNALTSIEDPAVANAIESLAKKKEKPQDAYSFRCMPQVFGASLHALNHAKEVFSGEIRAAVDNPLIFVNENTEIIDDEENEVLSGGNFHGQPLALVLDYLKLAIAEVGNIVERQINKLVDPATNDGLDDFLIHNSKGINSGLMIPQYVAASLVSENKVLVHPASADSIPTSANTEDHVSMGAIAGRQALEILGNVKKIIAIAILNAHHAMQIRKDQFSKGGVMASQAVATGELFMEVKRAIPDFDLEKTGPEKHFLDEDRFLFDDIKKLIENYESFVSIAEKHLAG